MTFLHLEPFERSFRIRFLDISKTVFLTAMVNFFARLWYFFLKILALFHVQENLWKYKTILS